MHPKLRITREIANEIFCYHNSKATLPTPFHFHSNIELYLILEGQADIWVGTRYKRLNAGQFSLTLSYDAHRYEPIGTVKTSCLILPASMCAEFTGKSLADPFIDDRELFDKILTCIDTIAQNRNEYITNGCVSIILGLIKEKVDMRKRESTAYTDNMSEILIYINDNFKNNITLSSVSGELGYNPSYLSRIFKQSIGVGFNSYVTMLRLRNAAILLEKGESIEICAFDSGFNSMRTFYRAFTNEFGCTPKHYKKNAEDI